MIAVSAFAKASPEVRPSDDVEVVGVLNDFPSVGVPGGVQVQVGDAFAGQTLRVVLLAGRAAEQARRLADGGDRNAAREGKRLHYEQNRLYCRRKG